MKTSYIHRQRKLLILRWLGLGALLSIATLAMTSNLLAGAGSGEDTTRVADCIGDWSKASRIVRLERLAKIGDVARFAEQSGYPSLLKVSLCSFETPGRGGRYVYELVVRDPSGRLKRLRVDAKTLERFVGVRVPTGARAQRR
ncbi:MAG: hypothetical protein AAFV45_05285 [Pseudomonadota bacterium]